jgi:ribosomal subunit interface protein
VPRGERFQIDEICAQPVRDEEDSVDIVVTGRNVEVPDHYRAKVGEKLVRVERYDAKIVRAEIELSHETNRRQQKSCQKVEITLVTKGPAVRAEGKAENFYAALELAVDKLESRARRAADRRRDRLHARTPLAEVEYDGELIPEDLTAAAHDGASLNGGSAAAAEGSALDGEPGPGRIVRTKSHSAEPITVDQALFEMELIGHDFYLFNDADTGCASVVYRRHAFDYGLIRLQA